MKGIAAPREFSREGYFFLSWKIGAPRDPDELIDQSSGFIEPLRHLTIGPQGGITASNLSFDFSVNDVAAASSDRIGRFFYGSIRYTDIFERPHTTKFCFRVDGLQQLGTAAPQIIQGVCQHWNCTDDACKADKAAYQAELSKAVAEGMPGTNPRRPPVRVPQPAGPSLPLVPK